MMLIIVVVETRGHYSITVPSELTGKYIGVQYILYEHLYNLSMPSLCMHRLLKTSLYSY